jgi:branched-chain amino acid transport system substrate-binding protein
MKSAYSVHKKLLEAAGIRIDATETFQKGDVDYSAQLTKIKSVKPDAIVVSGLAEETANIIRQARELGIPQSIPIIGANAAISSKLAELAGKSAEGFVVGASWFIDDPTPRNQAFVSAYRKKFSSDPNVFSAQAYTAIYVFADAVKRAGGSADPRLIRDAIAKTSKLETNTGAFGFDLNREPIVEPKVLILKDGKLTLAEPN